MKDPKLEYLSDRRDSARENLESAVEAVMIRKKIVEILPDGQDKSQAVSRLGAAKKSLSYALHLYNSANETLVKYCEDLGVPTFTINITGLDVMELYVKEKMTT